MAMSRCCAATAWPHTSPPRRQRRPPPLASPRTRLIHALQGNSRVRMVTSGTGYITTIAGGGGHPISSGVAARQTEFTAPWGLAYDAAGNLYISDADNNAVVMVAAVTTIVSVVAGNGTSDFNGEGGLAVDAALNQPCGLAIDSTGNLFIADWGNNRVRVVDSGSGVITTYAGGGYLNVRGFGGYGGDGGPATAARLSRPWGLAFDAADNLYVSDWVSLRARHCDRCVLEGCTDADATSMHMDHTRHSFTTIPSPPRPGQFRHPQSREWDGHHHHCCRHRRAWLQRRRGACDERQVDHADGHSAGCSRESIHSRLGACQWLAWLWLPRAAC